ncbi:MAG: hypothetical protein E7299_08115 [Lachnospiraceae bacterium]|nr:hypothetical protein [Lachnospiraceae bacterium]
MKEFIEKLIGRLEEKIDGNKKYTSTPLGNDAKNQIIGMKKAIEIVNQLAEEYNNGWILTEESLPDNNRCVLIKAESTTIAGGTIIAVGACHNGFWFVQSGLDTLSFPCNGYKVVKWRELPKE